MRQRHTQRSHCNHKRLELLIRSIKPTACKIQCRLCIHACRCCVERMYRTCFAIYTNKHGCAKLSQIIYLTIMNHTLGRPLACYACDHNNTFVLDTTKFSVISFVLISSLLLSLGWLYPGCNDVVVNDWIYCINN